MLEDVSVFIKVKCPVTAGFTANATELQIGEPFLATNISQNANSYEWWINGVLISSDLNFNYTFSNPGHYSVILQSHGTYCSDSYSFALYVGSDTPCLDTIANLFYELTNTNTNINDLRFEHLFPNGDMYLNSHFPFEAGMISKVDVWGNVKWHKKIEATNVLQTLVTEDGGITIHYQDETLQGRYICKMDGNGEVKWIRKVLNNSDQMQPLDNGVFIFDMESVPFRAKIMALDENGATRYNKVYDLENSFAPLDIEKTADQTAIWVVGYGSPIRGAKVMKIDTAGNVLSFKNYGNELNHGYEFRAIDATPDGGFVFAGRKTQIGNDFLIGKCDADGQVSWSKLVNELPGISGLPFEIGSDVITKPDGNGYFVVYRIVDQQSHLLSFSKDGVFEYGKSIAWPSGTPMKYVFLNNFIGKLFLSGRNPDMREQAVLARIDPGDGSFLGCLNTPNFDVSPFDVSLTVSDIPFSLSTDTVEVEVAGVVELAHNHQILKTEHCFADVHCPEICGNSFDDDEDGYIDCFDEDCDCFDGKDCNGFPLSQNRITAKIGHRSFSFGEKASSSASPMVANLNPLFDNIPEIIVAEGTADYLQSYTVNKLLIYKGDGSNWGAPYELTIPYGLPFTNPTPAIGDVNNDGFPELVVVTNGLFWPEIKVYSYYIPGANPIMSLMVSSSDDDPILRGNSRPGLADFNSDGISEIYVNNDIFQFDFSDVTNPTLTRVLDGIGHEGTTGSRSQPVAADILRPIDCNNDPDCAGLELIAGGMIYSIDLDSLDGDGPEIKVQRDLNLMGNKEILDGYSHVADVNLDGILDVVTYGYTDNDRGIYIWDKDSLIYYYKTPNYGWPPSGVTINNVYDDRADGFDQDLPEIVFPTEDYLYCFNLNAATLDASKPYWWRLFSQDNSGVIAVSSFDLNGDGYAEIFKRDEETFRILYGGAEPYPEGVGSSRYLYLQGCRSSTSDEYPIIADIDDDGEAEILFTCKTSSQFSNANGRLYEIESDSIPWMPARAVWNQYNYSGLQINDDLTVPKHQQANHLEFPNLGSGKRPFNIARAQTTPFDDQFDPYIPVPDADIQIDTVICDVDSFLLRLTIYNRGSASLPDNLPISFYQNDPTVAPATLLNTTISNTELPIDSCISFVLKIPAVYDSPVFIAVNDNGTLPTPFVPSTDFPNTGIDECVYENNLTHFEINHQSPTLDLGPDIVTCNSNTHTLQAGSGFVKYRWQDGSTDASFTTWEVGKYWMDAWDPCGFKQSDTILISLDQAATFDLGDNLTICAGDSVDLNVSGFTDVRWWPADGLACIDCPTTSASPTTSITYHATASEGNCFSSDSIRITVVESPTISLEANINDCAEPVVLTANSTNGAALDFIWSNGTTGVSTQIEQNGVYAVTATNSYGCSIIDSIQVEIPNDIELDASVTPIKCFGETGIIVLQVIQAAKPYNIVWSNGETGDSLSNLFTGTYSMTLSDAQGCEAIEEFTLEEPLELTLTPVVTHISCNNDPGSIALHANGGTAPLSYSWSHGASSDSTSINVPGQYTVTVMDSNGCEIVFEQNIAMEEPLEVSILFTEIQCHGGMDGSAELLPLNGLPPYQYSWENGAADSLLTGLDTAPHTVTIIDAEGCEKVLSFNLTEPDPISIDIAPTPVNCFGEMNGTALAEVTGSSPGYSYLWSNGEMSQLVENLSSGIYYLTITDEHGCQDSAEIFIEEPPLLEVEIVANPSEVCPGEMSQVAATPTGGVLPYTYLWNNTTSDSLLENVMAGLFEITVTDSNGCEAYDDFALEEISPPISVQDTIKAATGATISDGAIHLDSIEGGTPPFNFLWSNGDTSQSITDLLPGIYSLTITDALSCDEEFAFEVGILVGTDKVVQTGFEVSLFPNPAPQKGYGILSVKTISHQSLKLQLYDVTGRLLRRETIKAPVGKSFQKIRTPEVAGVYLLRFSGKNGQQAFLRWIVSGK